LQRATGTVALQSAASAALQRLTAYCLLLFVIIAGSHDR